MAKNSPRRRGFGRGRSSSPKGGAYSPTSSSPGGSSLGPGSSVQHVVRPPQPYMKQLRVHPSGCQQWSTQIVTAGGVYMAYASTLTTYVYDIRDFSLVALLGGNNCNVHSILWHPTNPHRVLVLSTNGRGSEWDVRSEERMFHVDVGAPPACSAWDPADPSNFAVVSKGANEICLMGSDGAGKGGFRKGCYSRRCSDQSLAATCAKWSLSKHGVLVVGWTDGRVSFSDATANAGGKGGKTKIVIPSEDGGSVVDLRHDPNKGPYMLIGYSSGTVVLWDAGGHCCVATFDRCMVGLAGIRWMAWAPGNFLVLSSKTAVGKVFTISQNQAPIGTVKLGETGSGVKDMAWLPSEPGANGGGGASAGPRAICGFRDGSLSVADTAFRGGAGGQAAAGCCRGGGSGAIPWASKAGHVETVFACGHRPGDPNTLATGSYAASVKVWHLPTMDLKMTLAGQSGAIYCVAWSLDGERIASTSANGSVWIWDVKSGKAERQIRLHHHAVHTCQWCPFQPKRLASASADRSLIIFSDKGAVHRVYDHPNALFGCNWCPTHENVIATGCRDGKVRVFDCSWKEGLEPQYVLSGHTQRVFHVRWSPLLEGTLASGSDDASVIVWCLPRTALPRSEPAGAARKVCPSAILKGHTSNVRPLHWNSEVPWLLLSGSWDGTVRAWDIRKAGIGWGDSASGAGRNDKGMGAATAQRDPGRPEEAGREACVAVMSDHVADVYGLSASPSRPFLYASVSRDTTLRLFSLEGIASSIKARAVLGSPLSSPTSEIAKHMLPESPTALCGTASRFVESELRNLGRNEGASSIAIFEKLFDFFWDSDGVETFWTMVRWVDACAAAKDAATCALNPTTGESAVDDRRIQGLLAGPHRQRQRVFAGDRNNDAWGTAGVGSSKLGPESCNRTNWQEASNGPMYVEERVVHRDARRASDVALARRFSTSPAFVVQDRRLSRSDRLERASRLYLVAGDLRGSCEAHIALGRWQMALSLAPGVGMEYWRAVADRYIEDLLGGGESRDSLVDNPRGSGGQAGTDVPSVVAALLASTGRPLEAVRGVLRRSEEALSLAVAVADGAYPPPVQPQSLCQEIILEPVAAHAVGEAKGTGPWAEKGGKSAEKGGKSASGNEEATGIRGEDRRQRGAKRLAVIDRRRDSHLEERSAAEDRRGLVASTEDEEEEGKALPKHNGFYSFRSHASGRESGPGGTATPVASPVRFPPIEPSGFKRCMASPTPPPPHARPWGSHRKVVSATAMAPTATAQRYEAEATLRSITESKAEFFFQASHPALAAAAILSTCDGTRATAAPAVAFLVRGEEPELAYAAAKALKFPARELSPLLREMARRAEAWGDPNLAVELLLNSGREDDNGGLRCRHRPDSGSTDDNVKGENHDAEGGYWSAEVYGACGEEAGPRGAAMVATRALASSTGSVQSGKNPCPSVILRSRASYLEDAAAAVRRNMDVEAVRLLVLGGDLEQAAERGVSFLRKNVQALSFPPQPANRSAAAVVRALGSGSGGGISSNRVSPGLRMEVLAYASYIGAMEAVARGYSPVVAALLRTASSCVKAAEKAASGQTGSVRYKADEDEKGNADHPSTPSPSRRRGIARRSRRSPPSRGRPRSRSSSSNDGRHGRPTTPQHSPSRIFPPCMSAAVLASATVQHLTFRPPGISTAGSTSSTLATEARSSSSGGGGGGSTSSGDDESKRARGWSSEEKSGKAEEVVCEGRSRRRRTSILISGNNHRDGTIGNAGGSSPLSSSPLSLSQRRSSACGEIIASGSRLPSCRHHARFSSRAPVGDGLGPDFRSSPPQKRAARPLAASSLDFWQEVWPPVRGATLLLEDGETVIGLNEAIMWAKVNPFSPLNTGCRMMPF